MQKGGPEDRLRRFLRSARDFEKSRKRRGGPTPRQSVSDRRCRPYPATFGRTQCGKRFRGAFGSPDVVFKPRPSCPEMAFFRAMSRHMRPSYVHPSADRHPVRNLNSPPSPTASVWVGRQTHPPMNGGVPQRRRFCVRGQLRSSRRMPTPRSYGSTPSAEVPFHHQGHQGSRRGSARPRPWPIRPLRASPRQPGRSRAGLERCRGLPPRRLRDRVECSPELSPSPASSC